MAENKFWVVFIFAVLAGLLTAYAFVASIRGKFDPFFSLGEPIETAVAFPVGVFSGGLLSLWGYFCLWDKKLIIILPLLYGSAFAVTVLLNIVGERNGLKGLGFWGAYVFWMLALLLARYFAPKLKQKKA
ncbi:MAG: hypothetical protein ACYDIC_11775 [Desulfobaccales bacterium]